MKAVWIGSSGFPNDGPADILGQLPDIEVVMRSDHITDAPELCAIHMPELIVIDALAKNEGVPSHITRIKQDYPGVKVFVLTCENNDDLAHEAKEAGADIVAKRSISLDEWRQLIRYAQKHYRVYLNTSPELRDSH